MQVRNSTAISRLPGRGFVWLLIVAPAFFDWAHGYLSVNFDINALASVYRIGLLALGFLLLALRPTWAMILVCGTYFLYLVMSYLVWSATSTIYFPEEVIRSANVLFLPMCFWILSFSVRHLDVTVDWIIRQIVNFGMAVSVIVIVSLVFDFGVPTYYSSISGSYGFGSQSYYLAGNVLGLSLAVSLAVALVRLVRQPEYRRYLEVLVIYVGAFSVGSRTGTVVASILLLAAIVVFVFIGRRHRIQRAIVASVVFPILIFSSVQAYKAISEYSFMATRLQTLVAGNVRSSHSAPAWKLVASQTTAQRLAGSSFEEHARTYASYTPKKYVQYATAETDPVDVIGAYGVAGLFALYLPYAFALACSLFAYMRTRSLVSAVAVSGLVLLVGHSVFAGHVVFSSQTTQLASVFIFLGFYAASGRRD